MKRWQLIERFLKLGGPGSGHHGHAGGRGGKGRPGGSQSSGGGFGSWSSNLSKSLVTKMEKRYPKFYKRIQEHHETNLEERGTVSGTGYINPSEIPAEVTELTQWDLKGRLGGNDHVRLYSGWYDHSKGPMGTQLSPQELRDKLDQQFPSLMSFTTDPAKAYDFAEGSGPVISAQVPISSILVSPFTAPVLGDKVLGEFEYIVAGKGIRHSVRDPGRFRSTVIQSYKKSKISPETLFGYRGARPGKQWSEK